MTVPITTTNGADTEARIQLLEWCVAEQAEQITRIATMLGGLAAQIAQPALQKTIAAQLIGRP